MKKVLVVLLVVLSGCVGVAESPRSVGSSSWNAGSSSWQTARQLSATPAPFFFPPGERVAWETRDWPDYRMPDFLVTMALIEQVRPDPPIVLPVQASRRAPVPMAPDAIQALVAAYFNPEDVPLMLRVAWCESRYNITAANPRSSARGLFQIMGGWYTGSWASNAPFDPYDPYANVSFAAWLYYQGGGISHWYPSKGCWA